MLNNARLLLIPYFLFLPFAFALFGNCIDSADFVQYADIARAYASGDISCALNGFWSPLLSWLMVPFYWISGEMLLSLKIVQALVTLLGVHMLNELSARFTSSFLVRVFFSVFCTAVLFHFAFLYASPDALFCVILIAIITLSFKARTPLHFMLLGVLGALLYFSKSFGFVFFPLLVLCYFLLRKSFAWKVKNVLTAAISFSFFSGAWITALSVQAGKFTWSEASEYNRALLTAEYNPNPFAEISHPIDKAHINEPPACATTAWIHPLELLEGNETIFNVEYYSKLVLRNVVSLVYYYWPYAALLLVLLLLVFFSVKDGVKELTVEVFPFIVAGIIMTVVYCLILTQRRYLIFNEILFMIIVAAALDRLAAKSRKIFVVSGFILFGFVLLRDYRRSSNGNICADWTDDPLTIAVKESKLKLVSLSADGAEGYTKSAIISFFGGAKVSGIVSTPNEIGSDCFLLVKGNNTIRATEFPFSIFLAYSPELKFSVYKIKREPQI